MQLSQDVRRSTPSYTSYEKKGNYAEQLSNLRYNPKDRASRFLCSYFCNNKISDENREFLLMLFRKYENEGRKLCIFISDKYKFANRLNLKLLYKRYNLREFSIHGDYPYEIDINELPKNIHTFQLNSDFTDPIDLHGIYNSMAICGTPVQYNHRHGSPRYGSQSGSPHLGSQSGSPRYGSQSGSPHLGSQSGSPRLNRSDFIDSWRVRGSFDYLSPTQFPDPDSTAQLDK